MPPLFRALALLALGGCAAQSLPPLTEPPPALQQAAVDTLKLQVQRYPGGEPYDVASDKGSVVLLDVWATWCEPCRDALPLYEQLAHQYAAQGLKVYALNVDEDVRAIPPFLAETKVQLPVLLDPNAQVAESVLRVRMMPTTYLVDRRGTLRYVHEGFSEEFLARYQKEIEELLAEKP